jgi:hypothetical protein
MCRMIAFLSVWTGLLSFLLALVMVIHRPMMTDWTVTLVLWFGSPGSLCLAGLVLWAYRKEGAAEEGIGAQRRQAKAAIGMALAAAALVYLLIIFSHKIEVN